ncbi:MAG TPA: ankyrin repeat domain-containing protein, partial [Terracidiphilus sp.]
EGLKLALSYGADPNSMEHWGISGMHHSVKRDNGLVMIAMLLDHGGDVTIENKFGFTAAMLAAWRGREDVLRLLNERDIDAKLEGLDLLIAACALADDAAIWSLTEMDPGLVSDIDYEGGTLLAQFAGNGNVAGMERLMEVGVPVDALYEAMDTLRLRRTRRLCMWRRGADDQRR